jgi:hypothetical protein
MAFLAARLAEDYYLAHKFAFTHDADWDAEMLGRLWWYGSGDAPQPRSASDPIIQHVARHDPARVLREVAAGRRMISEYERWQKEALATDDPGAALFALGWHGAILAKAAVYSDHPDYQQEWKAV